MLSDLMIFLLKKNKTQEIISEFLLINIKLKFLFQEYQKLAISLLKNSKINKK